MQKIFELDAAVARRGPRDPACCGRAWRSPRSTAPRWSWPERRAGQTSSARPRRAPGRCCGSPRTSAPPPAGGSAPRSAATTTARTPWPTSWKAASGRACSTSPTAASSPWTAGCGSPPPAPTWPGGSRTARNPSPSRPSATLPDGSELVMLHESDGMRTRRSRETGEPARAHGSRTPSPGWSPSPSPRTTRSGRAKTTRMRVLTTLLDHEAFPAREIAALYAERWQIEIAFLHLKKTVRGPRRAAARPVPGTRPPGSLGAAAHPQHHRHRRRPRRRGSAGHRPRAHPVHRRARPHPRPRRRRHPLPALRAPPRQPRCALDSLNTAILALPRHRQGRQRTSGRTAAERRTRHTEEVTYTIDITKSNLPKWDTTPET